MATRGYSNFYIFSSESSFVIVAADDRVKPIIGYSDTNPFVIREDMTNVAYWLDKVNNEIQYVIDNNIEATAEIENEWKTLVNGNKPNPKHRASVDALLTTLWNQSAPFNNMCPLYGSERTVTGCAATAMAMVMKYWNWPKTGTGSKSYAEPTFGTLSVDFSSTTYDWENMKDNYNSTYTSTEANAVATLMYHCGVSIEMQYGTSSSGGSGAYPDEVQNALTTYFDYNTATIKNATKDYNGYTYYSDSEWMSLLKSELDEERPVLYSGWDTENGGHSFVCDGYDSNDNFHFNWGWGGYCDGYFEIGTLNPGTGGIGSGSGVYSEQNFIIYGVEPNPENYYTDYYTFVGNGSWNTPSNWIDLNGNIPSSMPDLSDKNVLINGAAVVGNGVDAEVASLSIKNSKTLTIQNGGTFTVNEKAVNSNFDAIIVEEGAQVFMPNENVAATFKKSIAHPETWETDHDKGWQFIASPLKDAAVTDFVPSSGNYDLFKYDGTQELQWQNHKDYGENVFTNLTYTFDTGFDGWTTIDGDGDGYTFFHSSESATYTGYSFEDYYFYKDGIVIFATYAEYTFNNYLVAPTKINVVEGTSVSINISQTIFSGEPEQIGVAISTASNTSASDFTTIANSNNTFDGSSSTATYTVDLSDYAGEEVWVAIHHNTPSISEYALYPMIDEVTITKSGPSLDFEDTFQQGRGYLASYETETNANIKGCLSTETAFTFPVAYDNTDRWSNFYVLGNPFTFDINWKDFTKNNVIDGIARMTTEGSYQYDAVSDIKVGEGFMVMTKGTNPSLQYGATRSYNESYDNINIIASGYEGSDNVIINFNGEENEGFPKLDNFNENIANVFVKRDGKNYGICSYDTDTKEIPLYFDAKEMGSYTIAIETEGLFDNVYLYDRMTDETIDLLAEKEYKFTSTTDENPNRFVLRLNFNDNGVTSENFVYQSGENLYIDAEGSIQIIDMMGRIIYSNDVAGGNDIINVSALNKAAYFVRNVNEDQVRIQKIVVL